MRSAGFEAQLMRKVWRHCVPLLTATLFFNYLDRVNVGFAALQMNRALNLTNTAFGVSAGVFAGGYALAAIPSTVLLHRVGARRWLAFIVIAWGCCSAGTAFVRSAEGLAAARLLLGLAEAGFAPGVILYFSLWFPSAYRGRVLSSFLFIQPVALIIGAPLSTGLLTATPIFGLQGWQSLFIIEALPTALLAPLLLLLLTDRPTDAKWLGPEEQAWLTDRLATEAVPMQANGRAQAWWQALRDGRVWLLAAVYLGIGTSGVGLVFFLPLMIRAIGFSVSATGWVAAIPAIVGALALPLWGFWADRSPNRVRVIAASCVTIAVGATLTAISLPLPIAVLGLSIALSGFYGCTVTFWTLPPSFLAGSQAAAGLGLITIVGNLGSFTGPAILGRLADATHSYATGLLVLAMLAMLAAGLLLTQSARFTVSGTRHIAKV